MSKLNRHRIIFAGLLLVSQVASSQQDQLEKAWEKETRGVEYTRNRTYKGPEFVDQTNPASLNHKKKTVREIQENTTNTGSEYDESRTGSSETTTQTQQGNGNHGGNDDQQTYTEREPFEPIEYPEEEPETKHSDWHISIPPVFWYILFTIVILIILFFITRYLIKNRTPKNSLLQTDAELPENVNPAEVPKSELELKLETAINKQEYREAVRIYFTFIMRELIIQQKIRWNKEKTNHHYLQELSGKPDYLPFSSCVRIYDLVWYGEYNISESEYREIKPVFESYYQQLTAKA